MKKEEKEEKIEEIKGFIKNASSMFLVNYSGVNVADINKLRAEFRKEGINYKVLKNTLFKKALQQTSGYDSFNSQLVGMIGVAFVSENFVSAAKIIKKYFDEKQKFSFKGCYIESTFYGIEQLNTIASMPTKNEIMSGIVGSIAAPATGIVGAINAVIRDLVSVIDEISKKEAA
jgi:large subunit ribosomal protein L10